MKITWSAQLGRRPRRLTRSRRQGRAAQRHRRQGQVRVRADLHVLPAADLRALPQPVVRRVVPVRCDLQARRGRHRPGRPGPAAAAGGCASPAARTRRSTSTTAPARPRSARSASRASRSASRPSARRPASGRLRYIGLMLYDADKVLAAASTDGRHGPVRGAARGVPRPVRPGGHRRGRAGRHPARLDRRRAALAGLRADQHLQGRAAAASGVPHDADGLVHPAAVAGRRRRARHRLRRRGQGQPVRRDRRAAHPDRVPRRAVHRRRRRAGRRGAAQARRDALLHARHQHGPRPERVDPGRGRHDRRADVRHVPAAGHRQVRRALRHPGRARRAGALAGGARHRVQPRLRRRPRHGRLRTVRRDPPVAPSPIAVENFQMLRERQTSDTIVDPADGAASASTC